MRRLTRAFVALNARFAAPALTRNCTGFAPTVAVSCRSGRAGQQASWPHFRRPQNGFTSRNEAFATLKLSALKPGDVFGDVAWRRNSALRGLAQFPYQQTCLHAQLLLRCKKFLAQLDQRL